jgi:transposase InsO family protein
VKNGARKYKACEELGITVRTLQRWTQVSDVKIDGRARAKRARPANKLSEEERSQVLSIINSEAYKDCPPSQIVPALADKGEYIASESSFYRIMREDKQQQHRGRSKAPERKPISTHAATAPNQLWCWDISWLPGPVKGIYFYLYLILDVYSRKIVGWEIHEEESSENASYLVTRTHLREGVGEQPLVLHSDNGSPMKGASLLTTLYSLGIASSYSRPRVSNDNPYVESIFRTCKYRPDYPYRGFADIAEARQWVLEFVHWYNCIHRHSGLKFVSPNQRHEGVEKEIMDQREVVYEAARAKHPERWSGNIRNWELPMTVYLNPEKEQEQQEVMALAKTG